MLTHGHTAGVVYLPCRLGDLLIINIKKDKEAETKNEGLGEEIRRPPSWQHEPHKGLCPNHCLFPDGMNTKSSSLYHPCRSHKCSVLVNKHIIYCKPFSSPISKLPGSI